MPGLHAQVLDQVPGEKHALKKVLMVDATAAQTTLYNGCAVCYNRDYGSDATAVDWGRAVRVEQPTISNWMYFAGFITGLTSAGYVLAASGSKRINIIEGRVTQVCLAYCAAATYTFGQLLYLQNASYTLAGSGVGTAVATVLQATTLSSAGALQVLVEGGG